MLKNRGLLNMLLLSLVLIYGSCRQDSANPASDESAYFPLQPGDYWIYQVTQETYSPTSPYTKRVFQVQEKITGTYTQKGQVFFQVEESRRNSDQAVWQLNALGTIYKNASEVVSVTNNVPVITLLFPVSPTTEWNTNAYNANPDTLLRYRDNRQPFTLGKTKFNHTISVVGGNDSTLVTLTKNRRVYAQNVGLVYRENASLAYCQSSPDCIGKAQIESGTSQKWELLSSNRLP